MNGVVEFKEMTLIYTYSVFITILHNIVSNIISRAVLKIFHVLQNDNMDMINHESVV